VPFTELLTNPHSTEHPSLFKTLPSLLPYSSAMESIFGSQSSQAQQQPSLGRTPTGYSQTSAGSSIQQVQYQVEKARTWLQNWLQNSTENLRYYANNYPVFAAFIFTLLLLSAVPVSVFVVNGILTALFFLSVAVIAFAAIEGTILVTTGGVLLAVLSCIALFTTSAFGFLAISYMGYKGVCCACQQLKEGASYIQSKTQEQGGPSLQQFMSQVTGQPSGTQPQASYQASPSSMPTRS
jgi:hypothetical protein